MLQHFCNSQRTKLHFCYTLEAHLSKSNSLYYGCSNIRHYNRHNNTLLLRCLCLHHRRHLQKPQFLIPNTLFPNTPLSPPASINLGVLPDFVLAQTEKMSKIESLLKQICFCLIISISLGLVIFGSSLSAEAHQCNHGHGHDHDHQGHHHHHHGMSEVKQRKLPEELAEEEDLKLLGFGSHDDVDVHHHHNGHGAKDLTGLGLWVNAMGCSLLVSLASLICLIILPVIFLKGKPSKAVVDSLALFGAGAMLGDAFLHQLPHAFGGVHSHSHDHHVEHDHLHDHSGHSHAHSLEDLSVGLSILAGIVLFLIVEKLVRYVEDFSGGADEWSHGHHHHHRHTHITKLKDDDDANDNDQLSPKKSGNLSEKTAGGSEVDGVSADSPNGEKPSGGAVLRKRNTGSSAADDNTVLDAANCTTNSESVGKEQAKSRSSLVFGYLNLFSDGVHNFTDGMALGSAFLLYGSVGGWSRTLFLLAHELPQEIGDFGILVRSGFSVSKALFFNFLSALVALAGTALALTLGQDSGQSSVIEGFTAGGFIYISVAGVLAEMNSSGRTTLMNTVIQLVSLLSGMAVALCISLVE
ncbi:PREDICTED: IAA-alanine resistance protein 1 [Nicotiana attenuata]|uniref:Iaa-alanine resistance protein 1 n=1 Tax=Nicotiana attenuata TaxID=49451 RepID=A0A1J6KEW3_NICAT|nr:PREDICTED: IAA-alanine resistance protein 1 [Nicotiana attenuata]OIT21355.1 iaa-alanine resistance protein 1 [Nicotiana attenuata]